MFKNPDNDKLSLLYLTLIETGVKSLKLLEYCLG